MDTSRLETLLEKLIDKQDELIARIESLETMVEQELTEANAGISELQTTMQTTSSQIHDELNWWGEGHSLAKQVLTALVGIESAVSNQGM